MAYKINGVNLSYDYNELLEELEADFEEKLIEASTIISIVRDKNSIAPDVDYYPIIDYYYPGFEKDTPDKLYNRDEYTQEEWEELEKEYQDSCEQYKKDLPYIEKASVLAVIEEMKQWNEVV